VESTSPGWARSTFVATPGRAAYDRTTVTRLKSDSHQRRIEHLAVVFCGWRDADKPGAVATVVEAPHAAVGIGPQHSPPVLRRPVSPSELCEALLRELLESIARTAFGLSLLIRLSWQGSPSPLLLTGLRHPGHREATARFLDDVNRPLHRTARLGLSGERCPAEQGCRLGLVGFEERWQVPLFAA